ncbi:MAG TPA: OmpH family outer membrane protein, partial [Planctomycetota bacterium]|nr:OmpH family outer membrane protein [Planctomycetota bacterium]
KAYKLNADVQQQRQKRVDELRKKIRATIAEFARRQGYSMVFEQSALLFGEEGKSLTIDIIDQMNGEYFKTKLDKKDELKAPGGDAQKTPEQKTPEQKVSDK